MFTEGDDPLAEHLAEDDRPGMSGYALLDELDEATMVQRLARWLEGEPWRQVRSRHESRIAKRCDSVTSRTVRRACRALRGERLCPVQPDADVGGRRGARR